MTTRIKIAKLALQEDLNFLLTNRIPRRLATQFVGWISRKEQPAVRAISMFLWDFFSRIDFSDSEPRRYRSVHDCFTRSLKAGARAIDMDEDVLVSPCDAIVGAAGHIAGTEVYQIKGFPYSLRDLMDDVDLIESLRDGCFITLRLTAGMYHRFHAPQDCRVEQVTYISGDTWNVNPIALKRVEKLFCKNERAILRVQLKGGPLIALVPVAAILVASIRLPFVDLPCVTKGVRQRVDCEAIFRKGDEMGWFEHGSTIVVFAPKGYSLCAEVREGVTVRMGNALLRRTQD